MTMHQNTIVGNVQRVSRMPKILTPEEFRRASKANGWHCLDVYSPGSRLPDGKPAKGKEVIEKGWNTGAHEARLQPLANKLNTGVWLRGVGAIDYDVDASVVFPMADGGEPIHLRGLILKLAKHHFGDGFLVRERANSKRMAIVVRVDQDVEKLVIQVPGFGKIERLGHGQQLVVDGIHESGAHLIWKGNRSPATVNIADVPMVTAGQLAAFEADVRAWVGEPEPVVANAPTAPPVASGASPARASLMGGAASSAVTDPAVVASALEVLRKAGKLDDYDAWAATMIALGGAVKGGQLDWATARRMASDVSKGAAKYDNASESKIDEMFVAARGPALNTKGETGRMLGSLFDDAKALGWVHPGGGNGVGVPTAQPLAGQQVSPVGNAPVIIQAPRKFASASEVLSAAKNRVAMGTIPIMPGVVNLVVARGSAGKTTFALHAAFAAATGATVAGMKVDKPRAAALVLREDARADIGRNLQGLTDEHGSAGALYTCDVGCSAGLELARQVRGGWELNEPGFAEVEGWCKDFGLVVIDALSLVVSAGLNDNALAAAVMGRLNRIAEATGCALVVLHHSGKSGRDDDTEGMADGALGAVNIVNQARHVVSLRTMTETEEKKLAPVWERHELMALRVVKSNYSKTSDDPTWFRREAKPVTLVNGEPSIAIMLRPVTLATVAARASVDKVQLLVIRVVRDAVAAGAPLAISTTSSRAASAAVARELMIADPTLTQTQAELTAKSALKSAKSAGRIVEIDAMKARPGRGAVTYPAYDVAP